MKKVLFVFVLSLSLASMAKAQGEGFTFAAGLRLGLPIGDFADTHSFGIGAEAQGEIGLSSKFSIVANTGFTQFFGKTIDVFGTEVKVDGVGLIPIIVGPRVYPAEKFFIGFQAGLGILTGGGDSETAFDWQPQIGVNTEHFQIALNYNGLSKDGSTLAHMGLTALFKLGGAGAAHKK